MPECFVPADFVVPDGLGGSGFRLVPLGPEHNDRDHAAWSSSIDHIHATPGFEHSRWPMPMSLEQNRDDIEQHSTDFAGRTGFTYSVLDGDRVVGCVYIYPASEPGFDAEVRSWVIADRADLDGVIWEAVSAWLEQSWPFTNPNYDPRR